MNNRTTPERESLLSSRLAKADGNQGEADIRRYYYEDLSKRIVKVSKGTYFLDTYRGEFNSKDNGGSLPTDGIHRIYFAEDDNGKLPLPYENDSDDDKVKKYDTIRENYRSYIIQFEFKTKIDFNIIEERAKVFLQVCHYLKQIHDSISPNYEDRNKYWDTESFPQIIVVGSKVNCAAIPARYLIEQAKDLRDEYWKDGNGNLKLYSASKRYEDPFGRECVSPDGGSGNRVYKNIINSSDINSETSVFEIKNENSLNELCQKIIDCNNLLLNRKLSVTNVQEAFRKFNNTVITEYTSKKLTNRQKIAMFMSLFFCKGTDVEINDSIRSLRSNGKTSRYTARFDVEGLPDEFKTLDFTIKFSDFIRRWAVNPDDYTYDEIMSVTAIVDTLLDEEDRRKHGDYYTPSVWVNEADRLIKKHLGNNYKSEYMVWDCAWGTGNLTREFYYRDLYCSTLNDSELDMGKIYNPNACKFQYDFLNDDVEAFESVENLMSANQVRVALEVLKSTKLYGVAPGLINSLIGMDVEKTLETGQKVTVEKKKLLFFINPPYGGTGNGDSDGSSKDVVNTEVKNIMKHNNVDGHNEMFNQFIYRILHLQKVTNADIRVGIFAKCTYLAGQRSKKLRKEMSKIWCLRESFMFNASEFTGTSKAWGVFFALLDRGNDVGITDVETTIIERVKGIDGKEDTFKRSKHIIYNMDNKADIHKWMAEPLNGLPTLDRTCYMSSAFNMQKGDGHNKVVVGNIGGLSSDTATVGQNERFTSICSCMVGASKGKNIHPANFDRVVSVFAARRLIVGRDASWKNDKDTYMVPDVENDKYNKWNNDCIVYSLFDICSYQTSLRDMQYQDKSWDIINNFFWLSSSTVASLIKPMGFGLDIFKDIDEHGEDRYVYKRLKEIIPDDIFNRIENISRVEEINNIFGDRPEEEIESLKISEDALKILARATLIVKESFKFREKVHKKCPKYHLNTWDAGWYQMKKLAEECEDAEFNKQMKDFGIEFKAFADRLRPLVYELGFLYGEDINTNTKEDSETTESIASEEIKTTEGDVKTYEEIEKTAEKIITEPVKIDSLQVESKSELTETKTELVETKTDNLSDIETTKKIGKTDINYNILTFGKGLNLPKGMKLDIVFNEVTYKGKMHNTTTGRVDGITTLMREAKFKVDDKVKAVYKAQDNKLYIYKE